MEIADAGVWLGAPDCLERFVLLPILAAEPLRPQPETPEWESTVLCHDPGAVGFIRMLARTSIRARSRFKNQRIVIYIWKIIAVRVNSM